MEIMEIKDPILREFAQRQYKKSQIQSEALSNLSINYKLDWKEEDLELLQHYLEKHGELPENPSLICQECDEQIKVDLYDYINTMINNNGIYSCSKCRKEHGFKKWNTKCKLHGFNKQASLLRLSQFDTKIFPEIQNQLKDKARQFIKDFPVVKSLWIYGKTGTGKSRYCQTIGIELLMRGCDVKYATLQSFAREGKSGKTINDWINAEVVILDDFTDEGIGFEYSTFIFPVIDQRYEMDKKMIITSNMSVKDLENSKRNDSVRLASRFNSKKFERILIQIDKDLRLYYD